MHIIFVYNWKCARITQNKVLNNGELNMIIRNPWEQKSKTMRSTLYINSKTKMIAILLGFIKYLHKNLRILYITSQKYLAFVQQF